MARILHPLINVQVPPALFEAAWLVGFETELVCHDKLIAAAGEGKQQQIEASVLREAIAQFRTVSLESFAINLVRFPGGVARRQSVFDREMPEVDYRRVASDDDPTIDEAWALIADIKKRRGKKE